MQRERRMRQRSTTRDAGPNEDGTWMVLQKKI
jgi:hypothetical protein